MVITMRKFDSTIIFIECCPRRFIFDIYDSGKSLLSALAACHSAILRQWRI
jgi:hypothetical protein